MNDQRDNPFSSVASTPPIHGDTDVYLILGDPIEQVLAPEIFNPLFGHFGVNAVLVPAQVAPCHLQTFIRSAFLAKNVKGLWLTIPHKVPAMAVLDECSALARLAGAVNAIRRNDGGSLEGALFDGEGFIRSLDYHGIAYAGKKVLILGAGGAAAAIGASLIQPRDTGHAATVAFYDPTPGKAAEVATRLQTAGSAQLLALIQNDPTGFDLVVNASPLGLHATDPLPCDVARLAPHAALVDIVMKNYPTPLLRAARARGLHAEPGFEMLIQQAHLYLDFFGFRDIAAALRQDTAAIRQQIYPQTLQDEIGQALRPTALPT